MENAHYSVSLLRGASELDGGGPVVVMATGGPASVCGVELAQGQTCVVPAGCAGRVVADGSALVARGEIRLRQAMFMASWVRMEATPS